MSMWPSLTSSASSTGSCQTRHLAPQTRSSSPQIRAGFNGLIDSLQASQYALETFRRSLPNDNKRQRLDRIANRLTKTPAEIRKRKINEVKWEDIGRLWRLFTYRGSVSPPNAAFGSFIVFFIDC